MAGTEFELLRMELGDILSQIIKTWETSERFELISKFKSAPTSAATGGEGLAIEGRFLYCLKYNDIDAYNEVKDFIDQFIDVCYLNHNMKIMRDIPVLGSITDLISRKLRLSDFIDLDNEKNKIIGQGSDGKEIAIEMGKFLLDIKEKNPIAFNEVKDLIYDYLEECKKYGIYFE